MMIIGIQQQVINKLSDVEIISDEVVNLRNLSTVDFFEQMVTAL